MHVRRKLIVGNWKMNGSIAQLRQLQAIGDAAQKSAGLDVAICPPFTLLSAAVTRSGGRLTIGAQDCHSADSGAHTGSISVPMIKEAGGRVTIVGHSERRAEQGESDPVVRRKAEATLRHGLTAIVCIGESQLDRAAGDQWPVVERQLAGSVPDEWEEGELVIAYEPVWAIGTGNVATAADVTEMHAAIRASLVDRFGDLGSRIRILYGGSVKADNAVELFGCPDVDGALVGGASLTAAQFVPIIEAAAAS
jgi:triosephosphate isomerase (TIM)